MTDVIYFDICKINSDNAFNGINFISHGSIAPLQNLLNDRQYLFTSLRVILPFVDYISMHSAMRVQEAGLVNKTL